MAMKLTAATNDNDGLETLVDLQVFLSLLAPNKLDYLGIAENIFFLRVTATFALFKSPIFFLS